MVSIIKNLDVFRAKRFLVENEFVVLPQKRHLAAPVGAAFGLVLRALVEAAETAEILAGCVEKEHVDLMVGDADLLLLPELIDRAAAQEAQPLEFSGVIEPDGEIHIFGVCGCGLVARVPAWTPLWVIKRQSQKARIGPPWEGPRTRRPHTRPLRGSGRTA